MYVHVYVSDPAGDTLTDYKIKAVVVRKEVRKVKHSWEKYTGEMRTKSRWEKGYGV